ncbi:hypothetical protein QN277_026685 [Acacia crassicarpa]|uniref:DUF4005 domain-containing protein n=1 Tax=Acacia crassicarpa TaxID=499986 RepID=A0AAE1JBV3_9FABA|nr:hypothetical protein QN277_026685 [Acacia crassicarpa]
MGKTRKWLRNLMSPKNHKDKEKGQCGDHQIPPSSTSASEIPTPKEKRRWSFRRPSDSKQLNNSAETNVTASPTPPTATDVDQNLQDNNHLAIITEEAAAIKIQSVFRSYLARKALNALRGIVKLQALVRGQLVRKQASATLRCMEALFSAQARACALRIRMASEPKSNQRHSTITRHVYDFDDETDMETEENIRIVKVDVSGSRENGRNRKEENHKVSPAISGQSSPASSKPEEKKLSFTSPVPNYMANTESSRAKFRSLSAPKQRPDTVERQLSRPRASMEARNSSHKPVMKMRRSSSHKVSVVLPAQSSQILSIADLWFHMILMKVGTTTDKGNKVCSCILELELNRVLTKSMEAVVKFNFHRLVLYDKLCN